MISVKNTLHMAVMGSARSWSARPAVRLCCFAVSGECRFGVDDPPEVVNIRLVGGIRRLRPSRTAAQPSVNAATTGPHARVGFVSAVGDAMYRFRSILPDRVFGSPGTTCTVLSAATAPDLFPYRLYQFGLNLVGVDFGTGPEDDQSTRHLAFESVEAALEKGSV
ncbi:hypothetical protein [Nocardia gipuzkoensis]